MVLDSEPLSKIFTVGLSYWRISKETYYGLPTRRVPFTSQMGSKLLPEINGDQVVSISPELTYFSISQYKR